MIEIYTMNLTLLPLEERKRRFLSDEMDKFDFASNQFFAHLDGLKHFAGKKVLEIGGTDDMNTYGFFSSIIKADYSMVRLEQNPENLPYVLPQRDFFHLPGDVSYDLIVSVGVFEKYAHGKDKSMRDYGCQRTNREYLEKLWKLTNSDGANIMGTISDPCLFSEEEIKEAGFKLAIRQRPFYTLDGTGYPSFDKDSELVVMVRER